MRCTIVAKTKALMSCAVTAPLFSQRQFSYDAAHILYCIEYCSYTLRIVSDFVYGQLLLLLPLITKTSPCNVYPLEPHFYIAKLGYTGVHLFFLFLLQNIYCGYSLEPPRRGGSNVYPQSMF